MTLPSRKPESRRVWLTNH